MPTLRTPKDQSIVDVVERLSVDLGEDVFEIVDNWNADLFAVGLARRGSPSQLAYVSTWKQPAGRCFLELEGATASTQSVFESVDYSSLRTSLEAHFQR